MVRVGPGRFRHRRKRGNETPVVVASGRGVVFAGEVPMHDPG